MTRTSITSLLDADVVSLDGVVASLLEEDRGRDALTELVDLGSRLPSGAIHAEAIWILSERPRGGTPLAPGSPWFALGRALAVVLRPRKASLVALLRDLGRYAIAADRVHRALGEHAALGEEIERSDVSPAFSAELAIALDAPPSLVSVLDRKTLGLRADLAAMGQRRFRPTVRIHGSLRPSRQRQRGHAIARDLLGLLPGGTFRVLLSDGTLAIEHLSPYVRDLGHALSTWGLENAERLSSAGLEEALRSSTSRPNPDLAALVVPDLLAAAPDLLEERRRVEESAGLELRDETGAIYGKAELSELPLPDEWAVGKEAAGPLAVIASEGDDLLVEALRVLLDSGRVAGLAFVLAAGTPKVGVTIPGAIVDERDGAHLAFSPEVLERAERRGVDYARPPVLHIGDGTGAPEAAMAMVGQARRARALGRLPREAPMVLTLYPREEQGMYGVARGLAELEAARMALAAVVGSMDPHTGSKQTRSQNAPGVSRRFRA